MLTRQKLVPIALCLAAFSRAARAGVLWNEVTQGDFSGDRLVPTPLILAPGDNELFGVLEGSRPSGEIDFDYFSVTVPGGFQLSALVLDFYDSTDLTAFISIQPGPIFPNDPDTVGPKDLMGWLHFGPNQVTQDLLPAMSANGYGFTTPLPQGTYSFWCQQLDDYTDWTGRFVVTPVPGPASLAALLVPPFLMRRRRTPSGR